ncbi:tyrosine-type recombinase/integrase [Algiphilus aromaticivorans]|uniref:tyrosine-type recombinase/integrase n=1 Tax=Algiphilus aromaticivorans TaxID=382454 RepID=UPI0005C23929|nr:tyrosine-type recombinase/integrase [Algiphilus aromaticivorans]
MTTVLPMKRTINSAPTEEASLKQAPQADALSFLSGREREYANSLISQWYGHIRHWEGNKPASCDQHRDALLRLLRHAEVTPWELRPIHVVNYLESRITPERPHGLQSSTIAGYASAWRSFQSFLLKQETINDIAREFGQRPTEFVTEANAVGIKTRKPDKRAAGWALNASHIDAMDKEFRYEAAVAKQRGTKSLLPVLRDRVMFHLAIHFALRVSELVTVKLSDFHASDDPRLNARFGDYGALSVFGKNDVFGTIPMREPDIHALLTWYLGSVRPQILSRCKNPDGICRLGKESIPLSDLLFPTERSGVMSANNYRKRLGNVALQAGLPRKPTPHTLRHTGCTLMVPLYSPEVAQKYMRHKHLATTLHYYHPQVLHAGNQHAGVYIDGYFPDDE